MKFKNKIGSCGFLWIEIGAGKLLNEFLNDEVTTNIIDLRQDYFWESLFFNLHNMGRGEIVFRV